MRELLPEGETSRAQLQRLIELAEATRRANTIEMWGDKVALCAFQGHEHKLFDLVEYALTSCIDFMQRACDDLCRRRCSAMPNNGDVSSDHRTALRTQRRPD